jgi:hypothetical protein
LKDTIGLICSVWDDPRGIMRFFEQDTITDFDYLVFLDGQFSNWVGDNEFPEFEVRDVVQDYVNSEPDVEIYYEYVTGLTEAEKRNLLFKRASQIGMDWALVVDADEIPYINKNAFDIEVDALSKAEYGCYSVILNNYDLIQRRPRLFDMREKPFLIQHPTNTSHNHIWSGIDGRDLAQDITILHNYNVDSILLIHDKEFYSDYRFECREKFSRVHNH